MLRRSLAMFTVCVLSLAACGADEPAADSTDSTGPAPATDAPPATDPPTTDPPTTEPPDGTDPPTTEPPTTDPPTTDPPTTEPPDGTDPCLVGTWELQSQRFFDELIAQSPEAFPGTVTHVGGRQFIEFSADGSARGGRDNWSFKTDGPQGAVFITLDAIEEGSYSVEGAQFTVEQSTLGEADMTIEMEVGGVRTPMPIPMGGSFPGEQAAAASGTYTCDGDVFTLTITEDGITLTNVWDRVAG